MIQGLLASAFTIGASWACDKGTEGTASCDSPAHARTEMAPDPSGCAKRAELVGAGNCSYSTSMMASKVLDEGAPYTYLGRLTQSTNNLETRVAAPFTIGPNAEIHVIANEVLGRLDRLANARTRLDLRGKILEVEGHRYFVITEFVSNS
ncbi:MAG: hypothetical protein KTR31_20500 [Myxococcales bacterium]|nr:hypothetical protein [Myxococcales bacterium]